MSLRRTGAVVCALVASLVLAPLPAWAESSAEVREEVAGVQAELDALATQIAEGEEQVRALQDQVDALADESIALQGRLLDDRDRLAEVVSTSYKENSDARTLALLLSSESMDELVSQVYYAQKVSDWQAECIERLNSDKEALEQRMDEISQAKDDQRAALAELSAKRGELDEKVAVLSAKAERLEEEEREAARRAAEEAARKAAEEQAAREAEERARQEAIKAAAAAGDVKKTSGSSTLGSGWVSCVASAYTIADNDPPGSTATASGVPLDESVPTVAMPISMNPSRFYGSRIEISYNGMSVVATVTDCGYMGGGSRGLDLTPAVFRAFGASSADAWGLRTVSYRFL
ncbi:MAG: hypothetical protein QM302_04800 [Acidobacteriota bacterium]|nr:hypothetical protein [Acidobacteriota bacterium]